MMDHNLECQLQIVLLYICGTELKQPYLSKRKLDSKRLVVKNEDNQEIPFYAE